MGNFSRVESTSVKYMDIPLARTAIRFASLCSGIKSVGANLEKTRSLFNSRTVAASGTRAASDLLTNAVILAAVDEKSREYGSFLSSVS
jgi:hypothetical protein